MIANSNKALLLSIRPDYADQIFCGTKRIELRRRKPRVRPGDLVFVYASSPAMALVGAFEVEDVIEGKPADIWRQWHSKAGIDKSDFDTYFAGRDVGFGLVISNSWRLPVPVELAALRQKQSSFRPPQSFHYLSIERLQRLSGHDMKSFRRDREATSTHRRARVRPERCSGRSTGLSSR